MTSLTAKLARRGPLADKTNILNMKSSKTGDYVKLSQQLKAPTIGLEISIKKRGRKKKNILLGEIDHRIDGPKTYANEKVTDKVPSIVPNRVGKRELFVKVTRIPNNKNSVVNREKTLVEQQDGIKKINVLPKKKVTQIVEFRTKAKGAAQVNFEEKNKAIDEITSKEKQQVSNQVVKDIDIDTLDTKNTFLSKKLFVKITRIPDNDKTNAEETSIKQSSQTRVKSVLVNENIYQIDENIPKPFQNNCAKVTDENNAKKINSIKRTEGKDGGIKIIPVEKNAVGSNVRNTIGAKELLVKINLIPDIANHNTEKVSMNQSSEIGKKSVSLTETEYIVESIMKPLRNNLETNEGIRNNKETEEKVDEAEIIEPQNNKGINAMSTKELFVKITQIPNNNKNVEKEINENQKSNPKKLNIPTEKPVKNVKFNLKTAESHHLRRLEPINYAEESIIDGTNNGTSDKPNDEPAQVNLQKQKKDQLPIYRKVMNDEPKSNNPSDLYEFVDFSPKTKKTVKKRRLHRSSMLFDKTTHEILQKIEEKEARAKKKAGRKKKVLKPVSEKSYDKKVEAIISNIREKICKKNNRRNLMITEKSDVKQTLNNQKKLTNKVLAQDNVPLNGSHTKVIQVNNLNDETSIIVHHSAIVPSGEDKSVPWGENTANNKENVTLKRGRHAELCPGTNVAKKPLSDTFDNLKKSVDIVRLVPPPIPLDCISVCSDSDPGFENDIDSCLQGQKKVPSIDSRVKVMRVMLNDKTSVPVHHCTKMPSSIEKSMPQGQSNTNIMENVTSRRGGKIGNGVVTNQSHSDPLNKPNKSGSVTPPLMPLESIASNSDSLNSQNDIDCCFGFDDDNMQPVISTSDKAVTKEAVYILENVVLRRGTPEVESPADFNSRRPNANSTMIHKGVSNKTSSPWRSDWPTRNPHFVSVKSNALPRIDQEPVMDHTLVEGFEGLCSRTPKKGNETPAKKAPVQQSILEFVGSHIEQENEQQLQGSLYDYEAFNSPVKKTRKGKENRRVEEVRRNLVGNKHNIVSSTPVQRRVLGDISNSSGEQIFFSSSSGDNTYFGFNDNSLQKKTPEKRLDIEKDKVVKPSRFDLSALKSYAAKGRKKKKVAIAEEQEAVQIPDKSISLVEVSNEESVEENMRLFEDPEEDNVSLVHIAEKKHRRKRLNSCDSDTGDGEKKRKKHKKTKLEIEQENWIEGFNQMCEEINQHELEFD